MKLLVGNLNILPFNNAKGSIIWRMNMDNDEDCIDLKEFAKLDPAQSDSLVHNNVQALRDICDSPSKASLSELMNGSIKLYTIMLIHVQIVILIIHP